MINCKRDFCISVIVPVFNAEKYLPRCVESIVNQSYQNLEILLVDDGSVDNSLDICKKYAEKDTRIHVIHKEHQGLVAARKVGIENVTGLYFTFVDADDYVNIDAYRLIMQELDDVCPDIIAYGLLEEYPDHTVKKENHFQSGTCVGAELIRKRIFPQMLSRGNFFDFGILPNLVCKWFKKTFFDQAMISLSEEVFVGEDADATFQLLANASSIQFINLKPYHYCKRNDSVMWKSVDAKDIVRLKNDLASCFVKMDCWNIMKKQLDDYITFVSLLKRPKDILKREHALDDKKIALYGAGGFGQAVYHEYKTQIVLWVDKNYDWYREMDLPVDAVEDLLKIESEYDMIFIAILNVALCREIENRLMDLGIKKHIYYYL